MATCELTVTNRPFGLTVKLTPSEIPPAGGRLGGRIRRLPDLRHSVQRFPREAPPGPAAGPGPFRVAIARRPHPFSSRTRQLSSSAPMVLRWRRRGRVGRRPISSAGRPAAGRCRPLSRASPTSPQAGRCGSPARPASPGSRRRCGRRLFRRSSPGPPRAAPRPRCRRHTPGRRLRPLH